ncbi:MAG: hypothetical protein IT279_04735 [Ignavibacteriaceae bacterium]|nr:hypothetical protein [Ignavibacteriaceae bacterium]
MKQNSKKNDRQETCQKERERLHREAVSRGSDTYKDPVTGFKVFTELFHRRRGICCGSGCRHCPF